MSEYAVQYVSLGDLVEHRPDDLLAMLQENQVAPMLFTALASADTFSLHVPSYTAGLEVGRRLKALRNGAATPIIKQYSFNGVVFNELPVRDEATYPNIFIVQSWLGNYIAVASQSQAYVAVGSSGSDVIYWENPSIRCNYSNGAWGAWSDNGNYVNIALGDEPYAWANYNIYKSGSLWCAASEPVLVE